ncbi:MAG: trimethylamine methyltransferase family protein [Chloroflexi bacterium]|nr:trimethylamine methyltransferase family protein [Chloroflexota bacterium]MBL7161690.1 trimethylamine methyltransferase family protein [Anaerolineales bacterium]
MTNIKPIQPKISLEVLSVAELESIQSATLHLLKDVGVRFPSERALHIFAEHGAQVDMESQIVRLPSDLVKKTINLAPRTYELMGRAMGTELLLDGSRSYFGTDGVGVETIDFKSRKQRLSTKEDVAKMARVADALSSTAFYWPMVSAQDFGLTAALHEIEASFNNTVKHVQTVTSINEALATYAIRMAEIISGDRERMRAAPPLSALICTITPLSQDKDAIEAAMVYAKAGIPVGFMAMPTHGSTAPATTGGALVVGNAELVSAIVLMQLVAPGSPVFYSLCASVMDPQTADYIVGIPEKYLCNTAAIQLAHDWGVPALAGAFAMDSPKPATWQLGRDSVYTSLMVAMAGADLAEGLGMIKASTLLVPEQIIFDDEIYHTHRTLVDGIDTSIDGLAMDAIKNVGPGGHFLGQKHTRKYLREIWIPELSHPRRSQDEPPSPDIRRRARAKFDKILTEHKPEPLEESIQGELRVILDAATKEIERQES